MWKSTSLNTDRGYMWTDECGIVTKSSKSTGKEQHFQRALKKSSITKKCVHTKMLTVRHVSAIYIKKMGVKNSLQAEN